MTALVDCRRGLAEKPPRPFGSHERAYEPSFDWKSLLAPVPGSRPTGQPARATGDYQRIEDARRHDDPALPQGVWQHDLRRADWSLVAGRCTETLVQRGKDLQVVAWLIDARLQLDGPPALADGFDLLNGLCQRYWPDLHPEIEADGDLAARLAPIEWLDHKLPPLLYEMPITRRFDDGTPARSWTDYTNAQRLERLRARDAKQAEQAETRGAVNLAAVQRAIEHTPDAFYRQLAAMLDDAERALAAFQAELDRQCGAAGVGFANLRAAIASLRGFGHAVLEERGAPEMPESLGADPLDDADHGCILMPEPADADDTGPASAGERQLAAADGMVIRSREDAYRVLAGIAEYLQRTEPHSPTPYLIQRAVTWGSMPLHQLLMELSAGRQDMSLLFELLGITATESDAKKT